MFRLEQLFFLCVAAAGLLSGACSREAPPTPAPATAESPADTPRTKRLVGPLSNEEAQALATMNDRLKEYLALHQKLEATLPKLPTDATPEQIDRNQRAFEKLIRSARVTAKPGDIFTAEARPVIRRLLATVFGGPDGKQLKESIMDENVADPIRLKLGVNSRYPDIVPLTSIPPDVLQTLPKLTEDLEYRFVGDWFILLDTHAHVIADYLQDVLPK